MLSAARKTAQLGRIITALFSAYQNVRVHASQTNHNNGSSSFRATDIDLFSSAGRGSIHGVHSTKVTITGIG